MATDITEAGDRQKGEDAMNGFLAQYVVVALTRQLEEDQRTNRAARHRPHGRRRRDRNRNVPR